MNAKYFSIPIYLLVAAAAAGCSSARDVEVTGEVQAAAGVQTSGKIRVEVFDVAIKDDTQERTSLDVIELDALGPFKATVAAEGEKLLVRALADADGDGKCTAGEPWAESELTISSDGKVQAATLELANHDCPKE